MVEIEPLEGMDAEIAQMQLEEEEHLLGKENVVGLGVGRKIEGTRETDEPCLSILVAQKLPLDSLREGDRVPPTLGKFRTDVVETGEIFAGQRANGGLPMSMLREAEIYPGFERIPDWGRIALRREPPVVSEEEEEISIEALRTRRRPAQGGYSVAHFQVTAGTIATGVIAARPYPGIPQHYYLLSNNHVLANSNQARVGDPILQPGPADGGRYPGDAIARLEYFATIFFDGRPNYVDAAIARADFHNLDRSVYWIGVPRGTAGVRINQIVQKTGRTTSYTTGRVLALNATLNVNYNGEIARFARQIVTSAMSAPGDSGSLVLDLEEHAVGLLFAGSSRVTILNPIRYVEARLGIRVGL